MPMFSKKSKKGKGKEKEEPPSYSNKDVENVKFVIAERSHTSSSKPNEGPNKLQKKQPRDKGKGKETKQRGC
ncbi:hypothetical protein RRF57_000897 [Xylaria bambusicola]|uniref:Uncharacterized protein n=1 Tax=Xylaria bambusicola TaxID=326684 RepID=A0AAN7UFY4_9PEZI